ncbi:MAG: hypothetical protein WKG06_47610 [Segetibacter sp.]
MIAEYSDKTKMLMQLHYSRLSEKDRRHYAAVEAIKLGHGGVSYISKVLAVDRNTIIQGKKELMALAEYQQIPEDKQRRPGGGRKKRQNILRLHSY